jgi:hypothetical protein
MLSPVFWTVLTMIMWADLFRKDSSQDVEYGGGFAICITVWVIAALWILGSYTKGSSSSAAVATGAATGGGACLFLCWFPGTQSLIHAVSPHAAGFGYVVTTGENAYQDGNTF